MEWEIKRDKPTWEEMGKIIAIWNEIDVMKERQNTVRERGSGNEFE